MARLPSTNRTKKDVSALADMHWSRFYRICCFDLLVHCIYYHPRRICTSFRTNRIGIYVLASVFVFKEKVRRAEVMGVIILAAAIVMLALEGTA